MPELERVCEVMQREFAMNTTICIGTIVETAVNINLCYEATNIALEYSAIRNQAKFSSPMRPARISISTHTTTSST